MHGGHDFKTVVDLEALQVLSEKLYTVTSIPNSIVSMEGEVLAESAAGSPCSKFHRSHSQVARLCEENTRRAIARLKAGENCILCECPIGLVYGWAPIVMDGRLAAFVFAGQLLLKPPDSAKLAQFEENARTYGFDADEHLASLKNVPVIPEERFRSALGFLSELATLFAELGLKRFRGQEALEAVSEREQVLSRLLNSTTTVPWELELATGVFTFMGFQAQKVLGRPAESLRTLDDWMATLHAEDREWAVNFSMNETSSGRDHEFTYRMLKNNGEVIWVKDVVHVVMGADGPERLVGFMHDDTARVVAEAHREELEARLRNAQKMEAMATLAGGIAHDFNNILGAIIGYTEMTALDLDPESEASENLKEVLEASKRARNLVRQIRTFSAVEREARAPVEIGRLAKEVLALLRPTIPSSIDIRLSVDPHAGKVMADPSKVHQVFMNLCTNAFQAMRVTGGTLGISISEVALDQNEASGADLSNAGAYVRIVVSDTGVGMAEETLRRIFEPYYTTRPVGEGTGLGLAVVHGIVKGVGGSVRVSSCPGEGSVFTVYLPEDSSDEEEQASAAVSPPRGSGRLLFVDDETALLRIGKKLLEGLGYEVTVSADGAEAWKLFIQNPERFDVVITDMTMPLMNGVELATRMLLVRPGLPIILATGFSELIESNGAARLGFCGYLNKPLDRFQLAEAVSRALTRSD